MTKFDVKVISAAGGSEIAKGAQRLGNSKKNIVNKIRRVVKRMIYLPEGLPGSNFSVYISTKLNYDYTYLSNIFCSQTGITIQQFVIEIKIDRVKKLLFLNKLSLTEISQKLNYSSISHLSNQFRKITGLSPSAYKQSQDSTTKRQRKTGSEDKTGSHISNTGNILSNSN